MAKSTKSMMIKRVVLARNKISMMLNAVKSNGDAWLSKADNRKLDDMWYDLGRIKDKLKK
jgi:hypothetical protein